MKRKRHLYTWVDWAKEILGWIFGLVAVVILLPVMGLILKVLWIFFLIGWDLAK